ncbi:hypothetical protein C8R45DRAFT_1110688 [Mycena sanguinolenta]|nr:hypothetical protein C8R45DRAFT_1110688 [Mycena sanguinolenta]
MPRSRLLWRSPACVVQFFLRVLDVDLRGLDLPTVHSETAPSDSDSTIPPIPSFLAFILLNAAIPPDPLSKTHERLECLQIVLDPRPAAATPWSTTSAEAKEGRAGMATQKVQAELEATAWARV